MQRRIDSAFRLTNADSLCRTLLVYLFILRRNFPHSGDTINDNFNYSFFARRSMRITLCSREAIFQLVPLSLSLSIARHLGYPKSQGDKIAPRSSRSPFLLDGMISRSSFNVRVKTLGIIPESSLTSREKVSESFQQS